MLQTQSQHVFSHQHQYPQADAAWLQHQQQQQHQAQHHPHQAQQHSSLVAQQHAQVQAAAAAAAAAQQQHYNRIAMASNASASNPAQGVGNGTIGGDSALSSGMSMIEGGVSDENRKVFIWVAELLDANRRETALMELSKKREQVPELALVIWHSFGTNLSSESSPTTD
jgi:CCR4-NOT transcription complex subunit 9